MGEITCEALSENYTERIYYATNDEKFTSILQPLLAMIQHKLKGNYLYAEEYLIKYLQQNRTNVSSADILDLSRHMSACVAHLYIILVTMILSVVIGFPLVFCSKICYKKVLNPMKHQSRLYVQAIFFVLALAFLLIGCASSWNIGVRAQKFMERFPEECMDIIQSLHDTRTQFKDNCNKLESTIDVKLATISLLPDRIFNDITRLIDEKTKADYPQLLQKFNSLRQKMERVYENMEFIPGEITVTSRFMVLCDKLYHVSNTIFAQFSHVRQINDYNFTANESVMRMSDVVFPRSCEDINWENFYYNMVVLLGFLFSNTNTSIHFVDAMKTNLDRIRSASLKKISEKISDVEYFSEGKCSDLSNVLDSLITTTREDELINITRKIKRITTYSPLQRQSRPDMLKITTWIFLLPSIYGFLVFFLFVAALVGTGRGMHSMNDGNIAIRIYTISFYKIAICISIAFLWLILLVTALLYLIHIPTVVVCGAAKKGKFLNRYLDRPYWGNQTWIMYKLNEYIPTQKTPITIQMLLEKCSQNETIVQTLNLEKHVTKFKLEQVLSKDSRKEYLDILGKQKFANFRNIFKYIRHVDYKYLNSSFVFQVLRDLNRTEKSIGSIRNLVAQNLLEDVFSRIILDAQDLMVMLRNITDHFVEAKRLVVESKEEVVDLIYLNTYLQDITRGDMRKNIDLYLRNITEYVNCLHGELNNFVKYSLIQGFGKCTFLPYIYEKVQWVICDYGLELLNCFWLSLAIMGFSILIASILACRLSCFVRGSYQVHSRYHINCGRYPERQSNVVEPLNVPEHRKAT